MISEHHALLCIAPSIAAADIPDEYKKQTPDTIHVVTDRLSIDDARRLAQDVLVRPLVGNRRVFVIVAQSLPNETQNALLKLFEEPPAHAHFYLVVPQEGMLLPTLRSRLQLLGEPQKTRANSSYTAFAEMSYKDRLEHVADLVKQKDIQTMESILTGAEGAAEKYIQSDPSVAKTVLLVRTYFKTPGASKKMLLEELALALPLV